MTRRSPRGLERRLDNLEDRRDRPHARRAFDADVPDEHVERIIRSSRAHLADPSDREVALETIRELQRRDANEDTPRFE